MFIFKHGSQFTAQVLRASQPPSLHRFASRISIPFSPPSSPPFPIIDSCPAPTCQCRDSPPDLDIEREQSLNGSMAAYAEHVLISTGRNDWKSRIEEEEDAVLVRSLKKFLLRGGKYVDPYHNVMVSNSSFTPMCSNSNEALSPSDQKNSNLDNMKSEKKTQKEKEEEGETPRQPTQQQQQPASAFLLPSFKYIPKIPTDTHSVETFIKAYIVPSKLHPSSQQQNLSQDQQTLLVRNPDLQTYFPDARDIDEILILICGHGGRDARCGKIAPILIAEFKEKLLHQKISVLEDTPSSVETTKATTNTNSTSSSSSSSLPSARIASISHIGGHKFAGNVIIYLPPSFSGNPLAGKGIWYGRVGPEHVEGIVEKTILQGAVIRDQFRGGIDGDGNMLRL